MQSLQQSPIDNLQKPKLAILSLSTFGYFERMAIRASSIGIETEFFDERPSSSVIAKLFYRVAPRFVTKPFVESHINAVCESIIANKFTHVLIVFAELLEEIHILKLKDHGLQIFRYTWDSLGNRSSVLDLDPHMSAIGSFDPVDCQAEGYTYIPLYSENVPLSVPAMPERSTDFFFCGTMHSNRPNYMWKIIRIAQQRSWKICLKLFYHSRWIYVLKNALNWRAISIINQISSVGFDHNETLLDCANARVVIDIQHPRQAGITMRTFEAIAQGGVVLTTNEFALKSLDKTLHDRVFVLDTANIEYSMANALAANPGPISEKQRYALSLERFLMQIFELMNISTSNLTKI